MNCKHLYYLYRYFCKMDVIKDKFIHAPSYSFSKLKELLVRAGMITLPKKAQAQFAMFFNCNALILIITFCSRKSDGPISGVQETIIAR